MDALLAKVPTVDANLLTTAQAKNARLIAVLESHGIDWRLAPESSVTLVPALDN
jgi:hypothetical protein